ncbi:MAG: bifunctional folylpolyglutamate synthase/dihydrofolate synthase [Novosphingobium sp.]
MRDFAVSEHPGVQAQLDRLAALSLPQGRLSLDPIRALLARLGDPQHALPPVFHVAGTNGKGSTCAFLRAALEAAGCRVHVYTSPHLVRFNERIRLAGRLIDDDALAGLLGEVLDTAGDSPVSFFEATTAAAFLAFARTPADVCVIEVGLGGRLDATNVVGAPAVCGIASLGIDHEAFLLAPEPGTPDLPLARIAWEKAGIAKPGVPLVTLAYPAPAARAVAEVAAAAEAPVIAAARDWSFSVERDAVRYNGTITLPLPAMLGAHQAANYALAVAMLRHQQAIVVPDAALAAAATDAHWPARLQRLGPGPLTALAPGRTIWLDGGHNRDAGAALARFFSRQASPGSLDLVIAMLAGKDPDAILGALAPWLRSVTALPVPGHDSHPPEVFAALARRRTLNFASAEHIAEVLDWLPPGGDVLIAGSLYLAGEVLRLNREWPD